ncbi:hypothetical protein ACE6H2_002415 [Prunus campanulata]
MNWDASQSFGFHDRVVSFLGSSHGWLVVLKTMRMAFDEIVHLFNPISTQCRTLPPFLLGSSIHKVVLSSAHLATTTLSLWDDEMFLTRTVGPLRQSSD